MSIIKPHCSYHLDFLYLFMFWIHLQIKCEEMNHFIKKLLSNSLAVLSFHYFITSHQLSASVAIQTLCFHYRTLSVSGVPIRHCSTSYQYILVSVSFTNSIQNLLHSYNPHKTCWASHLHFLSHSLELYSCTYRSSTTHGVQFTLVSKA